MQASSRDDAAAAAGRPRVIGVNMEPNTRCVHYHSHRDIVAIKLYCCGEYYACKECHDALAGHGMQPWPQEQHDARAILCGACGTELAISEYLACSSRCPACGAEFNPRCSLHHHFYFGTGQSAAPRVSGDWP